MTEQPGPGHMVMAAARTQAAPDGCLRDHSARHAPGTSTRPLTIKTATSPSSPSMISRRLPASSSFVLAAARLRALQLDSSGTAGRPGGCEENPEEQSGHPRRQHVVTGPGSYALLTKVALMGAAVR